MCLTASRSSQSQVRYSYSTTVPVSSRLPASVQQLYAFYYAPSPPLPTNEGWSIYSPRDEFMRMGVGSRSKAWRFTDINKDYSVGGQILPRWCVYRRPSGTLVQSNIPFTIGCAHPNKRHNTAICVQVSQQVPDTRALVFTLGQLCAYPNLGLVLHLTYPN
jgi:hypothetical protein